MNKSVYNQPSSTLEALGVTKEELWSRCRETRLVDARSMVAALLSENEGLRQQDIATLLGISQAAVSKMLTRHHSMVLYNAPYRTRWERINKVRILCDFAQCQPDERSDRQAVIIKTNRKNRKENDK